VARLTALCLARPAAAALLLVAVTLGAVSQLPKLHTEFGYRPLLGAQHPSIIALEELIDRFGGGFPVRVAWRCGASAPCQEALDPVALAMADAVTETLLAVPAVREVRSPANALLLVPTAEGFAVRRLVEHGESAPDLAALAERARHDALWAGELVSRDGRTGALLVQPEDAESDTSVAVMEALFTALAPYEGLGFEFHLVGHPVEFVVAGRELAESAAVLTPITLTVIALLLVLATRSWPAVTAALLTLFVALVWTFGALGALGWPQDSVLQTLAPLVLTTGVCDAIHLLSRHASLARAAPITRAARRAALGRAACEVARPCLVTTATTGGAFLSFATSDLETFVRFGVVAAVGVVVCLLLTFSLLPLLVLALPAERPGRTARVAEGWEAALDALARLALRRRVAILVTTALLFVACGAGWLLHLRVDTDGYEMYGEHSRVIRWIRFVEQHLGRSDTLEIEIALPAGVVLESPHTLGTLEALGVAMASIEGLGPARSVVEPIGWLHRLLHEDDPGQERVAATQAVNAALVELVDLQDPALLESWVSFERSHVRVSVEAEFQSAARRAAVLEEVHEALRALVPPVWGVTLTGPYAVGHDWVRDVQATQLRSFATAFALVFVVVAVALRSPAWAALAMIPTLLPVVVILGAMGLLGMSLDVGRSMIAAVILGIGVDDAVHLLVQHQRLRARGIARAQAVRGAVVTVGRPVVTTSVALALGFLALMISPWQTVASFGFFVALGILLALVADLLVLPALAGGAAERLGALGGESAVVAERTP
jgi:uncharacterized protein